LGVCVFFGIIHLDFYIAWEKKHGYLFWAYFVADKFTLLLGRNRNDSEVCGDEYHIFDHTGDHIFLFGID